MSAWMRILAPPPAGAVSPTPEAPFQVLLHRRDTTPDGHFRPEASFVVTKNLRTSGLWAHLSPEDGWALILLSTFVTPNGDVRATADQMEDALAATPREARKRLDRLVALRWRGSPVVMVVPNPPGPEIFVLAPPLLRYEEDPVPKVPDAALDFVPAARDAVVAQSRARYARPKPEVEREIAETNGWESADAPGSDTGSETADRTDNPARAAALRLRALGFERARAGEIVARYGADRVNRQADWLPYRNVRDPVRFLTVAIAEDYETPRGLRGDHREVQPLKPDVDDPGKEMV